MMFRKKSPEGYYIKIPAAVKDGFCHSVAARCEGCGGRCVFFKKNKFFPKWSVRTMAGRAIIHYNSNGKFFTSRLRLPREQLRGLANGERMENLRVFL